MIYNEFWTNQSLVWVLIVEIEISFESVLKKLPLPIWLINFVPPIST